MGTCQSEGVGFRTISCWDIVPEYYHHKDNILISNVLLLIKHVTVLPRYITPPLTDSYPLSINQVDVVTVRPRQGQGALVGSGPSIFPFIIW